MIDTVQTSPTDWININLLKLEEQNSLKIKNLLYFHWSEGFSAVIGVRPFVTIVDNTDNTTETLQQDIRGW